MICFRSIGSLALTTVLIGPRLTGAAGFEPIAAVADDHPVVGLKLIVVDKVSASGTAKVVFVTKDAAVTKGAATDPTQISATLYVAYDTAFGRFEMPAGGGWLVNKDEVAKYVNMDAPSEGTVRKSIIKTQKLAGVVAKSLGDVPLDISAAPSGSVFVVYSVTNGEETHRHCTAFSDCVHKAIAGGTGSMLVCKGNSTGDPACTAVPCGFVDQGLTVLDTCTNLEWEKKDGADGSGTQNPANANDVDNRYTWAGRCTIGNDVPCQPNAAASATCAAAGGGVMCPECGPANGSCNVDPIQGGGAIATVWDFINQLNAASFAGHSDWRLPTSAGAGLFPTGQPAEIESIVDESQGSCGSGGPLDPCIDPVFGPTAFAGYWSSSARQQPPAISNEQVYGVFFGTGGLFSVTTNAAHRVRAVRSAE